MSNAGVMHLPDEAYRRATAESRAMLDSQAIQRVAREIEVIAAVRSARLAKRSSRRRRYVLNAAACIVCVAAGFGLSLLATATPPAEKMAKVEAKPKTKEWVGPIMNEPANSVASYPSASSAIVVPKPQPVNVQAPVAKVAQVVAVAKVAAPVAAAPVTIKANPSPPVIRYQAPARPPLPQPAQTQRLAAGSNRGTDKKLAEAPTDNQDFVLPARVPAKPVEEPKFQEKTASSGSGEFRVVNVIEGAVIVRQGQTVRQYRIGDQMPNGQTLKSVDTDTGKFDSSP